jgi:hypothetical protein
VVDFVWFLFPDLNDLVSFHQGNQLESITEAHCSPLHAYRLDMQLAASGGSKGVSLEIRFARSHVGLVRRWILGRGSLASRRAIIILRQDSVTALWFSSCRVAAQLYCPSSQITLTHRAARSSRRALAMALDMDELQDSYRNS